MLGWVSYIHMVYMLGWGRKVSFNILLLSTEGLLGIGDRVRLKLRLARYRLGSVCTGW